MSAVQMTLNKFRNKYCVLCPNGICDGIYDNYHRRDCLDFNKYFNECIYSNAEMIKTHWTTEQIAKALIKNRYEQVVDYYYDDDDRNDYMMIGYYVTSDDRKFDDYNEAVEHEIEWLNQPAIMEK